MFFYMGSGAAVDDAHVYSAAPKSPVASTGQIIPVTVMHGSVRYLTPKEYEDFLKHQDLAGWVGVPFILVVLVLGTSPRGRYPIRGTTK
jgi:hypothetical protein